LPYPYWKWQSYFWSNFFLFAAEKQFSTPYYSTLLKYLVHDSEGEFYIQYFGAKAKLVI
jgi:hypothetical protein